MTAGWAVEPSPTCGTVGEQTADEVRRACAATQTCEIGKAGTSVRRAVLTCNRDEMIVDARSADGGQRLWSLAVSGSPADRARQAAVWIARSDEVAIPAPPEPPPPPAPERGEAPVPQPERARSGGVAAALVALDIPSQRSSMSSALGVQLGTAFALGRGVYVGPVLTLARARWVDYNVSESVALVHAAARVGWGAPWTDGVVGAYVDVGAGLWSIPIGDDGASNVTRIALPSIAPTLVLQYPRATLRPYLGVSGLVAADTVAANLDHIVFGASIAAGVAWSAW
jgi:hypothetical protein